MNQVFKHKAKITMGCYSFTFSGSREYVEQQVAKILEAAKKMPCAMPAPAEAPESDKSSKGRPSAKASKKSA